MVKLILLFLLVCMQSLSIAQTPDAFQGTWKVTWQGERRPQEARLVITQSGGTWKTAAFAKHDHCVGIETPIHIEQVDGNAAKIRLKFSEALHGCSDATIHIKKVDEKSMTGSRGRAELSITRE